MLRMLSASQLNAAALETPNHVSIATLMEWKMEMRCGDKMQSIRKVTQTDVDSEG